MATRGFIGFVADGTEKIIYNHWDSYPSGLGANMLAWLHTADPAAARDLAAALVMIDGAAPPTPEQVEQLLPYAEVGVGRRSTEDWYCLLRGTQGNPAAILAAGIAEDAAGFPADSLFAEWGYLVDFDAGVFEVYRGFQRTAHTEGRFADRPVLDNREGYVPVALIASWPLTDLPATMPDFEDEEADK